MRKSLLSGCLLAVMAAVVIGLGNVFGLDLEHVALLGAALGGTLGLVPDRSPGAQVGGFAVGFLAAWLGYALRAAVLPGRDLRSGCRRVPARPAWPRGLAGTRGRLPLWSTLLGVAAIVGAYEAAYTPPRPEGLRRSPTTTATSLLAAAARLPGHRAALLSAQVASPTASTEASWPRRTPRRPGIEDPRPDATATGPRPQRETMCAAPSATARRRLSSSRPQTWAPRRRPGPRGRRRHRYQHRDRPGPPRRKRRVEEARVYEQLAFTVRAT